MFCQAGEWPLPADVTTSDRVWPKSGLWGASFRVMFPLAALWAVVCVVIWQWGQVVWPNLNLSVQWHIHEMTFGFGGAAVAGYLLTACSSWTGRAPIGGWPLMVLAFLWVATRASLLLAESMPIWTQTLPALGYFWWIAALLTYEAKAAGKGWRPMFIGFCLLAGTGSVFWLMEMYSDRALDPILPVLGFTVLVTGVGARMVPAYLKAASERQGRVVPSIPKLEYVVLFGALLLGALALVLGYPLVSKFGFFVITLRALNQIGRWPWRPVFHDILLAMLVLGYVWLPIGFFMLGWPFTHDAFSVSEATHALMMGAMGGLIMAVSARAFAHRSDEGLKARAGTFVAFLLVTISVPLRLTDRLDLAASVWCAGWLLYLLLILPRIFGPVPRPVFSGARNT